MDMNDALDAANRLATMLRGSLAADAATEEANSIAVEMADTLN